MTTQWDAQIGFKKESTYGTAVTVDTFVEFIAEDLDYQVEFVQGKGMRVGRKAARATRYTKVKEEAQGSFTQELLTKGHGKIVEAAFGGTGTSTLISGSSYQQLFTPTVTGPLSSFTIQKGIPPLGGGSTNPYTFDGMLCSAIELDFPNVGEVSLKSEWAGRSMTTATSLATASYVSSAELLTFTQGSVTIGGSVTVPTTTALASGGTANATVVSGNLRFENALDAGGFNLGGAGKRTRKQVLGEPTITGNLVIEYSDNTIVDGWLAGSTFAIVLTFQGATAISGSNYPTFQVTIPFAKLKTELPKANGGEPVTISVDIEGKDNDTATAPIYVAIVTAETAI